MAWQAVLTVGLPTVITKALLRLCRRKAVLLTSSEDATATTTTTTTAAPAVTESSQAEVADTSTADENKPASVDSNDIAASAIEPSETKRGKSCAYRSVDKDYQILCYRQDLPHYLYKNNKGS